MTQLYIAGALVALIAGLAIFGAVQLIRIALEEIFDCREKDTKWKN